MSTMENAGGIPQWTLGDRLRKARETAGVDREEMAADIGRSVRTISNYESGSTTAPLLVVRQYALRCQVPIDWLQSGSTGGGPSGGARATGPVTTRYASLLRAA